MVETTEKFGIENLKKVLLFLIKFSHQLTEDLSDKKISFVEAIGLFTSLIPAYPLIKNAGAVKEEIAYLSSEEITELVNYIEEQLKSEGFHWLENENIINIVDDAIEIFIKIVDIIDNLKNKK